MKPLGKTLKETGLGWMDGCLTAPEPTRLS